LGLRGTVKSLHFGASSRAARGSCWLWRVPLLDSFKARWSVVVASWRAQQHARLPTIHSESSLLNLRVCASMNPAFAKTCKTNETKLENEACARLDTCSQADAALFLCTLCGQAIHTNTKWPKFANFSMSSLWRDGLIVQSNSLRPLDAARLGGCEASSLPKDWRTIHHVQHSGRSFVPARLCWGIFPTSQ
jgi:hypothetical protein